jgi:di/tricarboxylate transporter
MFHIKMKRLEKNYLQLPLQGIATGIHPLYLMIAAAVGCSFAFMLPVATPPNSIVFSTGYISVGDLVSTSCLIYN